MSDRIVFLVSGMEPWAPPSLTEGGIGGSETAVIHVAARLHALGWKVDVYGRPDYYEGVHGGVGYWDERRLLSGGDADIVVSWRRPDAWRAPIGARARLFWAHDHNYGPDAGPHLARYDRVLAVSAWHARVLAEMYDLSNTEHVPNGVDLALYDPAARKTPFQCVWSSSPDRDLGTMLTLFERLRATEPEARLEVAYGWQGLDARIAAGDRSAAALKDRLARKMDATPGVTWHGRIGQDALARIKSASWCAPYLTSFAEVSCISMIEAMAAGCVPVTSATGALPETVGDGGYVVPGSPHSPSTHDMFVRVCQAVLGEANARVSKVAAGRARAAEFTWDKSVARWQAHIAEVLQTHSLTGVASCAP